MFFLNLVGSPCQKIVEMPNWGPQGLSGQYTAYNLWMAALSQL